MSTNTQQNNCSVVLCTTPPDDAQALVQHVLEHRLAACVNVIKNITSHYHWQGKLEHAEESLLIIKTTRKNVPELTRQIKARHPYSVPEVIELPILSGNPDYLDWILAESTPLT